MKADIACGHKAPVFFDESLIGLLILNQLYVPENSMTGYRPQCQMIVLQFFELSNEIFTRLCCLLRQIVLNHIFKIRTYRRH